MFDFLDRFDKRMEFVAIVDSVVNRQNKNNELEQRYGKSEIDNLIVSVLVFIMERTLSEEHDCTLESIAGFLRSVLPAYGKTVSDIEAEKLARYLVKDILQNKGVRRTYKSMRYPGGFVEQEVRLIIDRDYGRAPVVYELTRQGYDFLFRTKEVDDALGFQIEEIRLQLQIEKHYYREAIGQSRDLVRMLLQKRREMEQFERQLRGNLAATPGEEYEELIRGIDAVLNDEYNAMQKIERKVQLARKALEEEQSLHGRLDEKGLQARADVDGIYANVRRALMLQRKMLVACQSVQKLYLRVLQDAILFHSVQRFDMQEEILTPLAACKFRQSKEADGLFQNLLAPLMLPRLPAILNLRLAYDRQARISENEEPGVRESEEMESEQAELERIKRRNRTHVRIVGRLLEFSAAHPEGFSFQTFYDTLRNERDFEELCRERVLFMDILRLYEIGDIDLELWKRQNEEWCEDCTGEFDLAYCLGRIGRMHPDFYGLRRIQIQTQSKSAELLLPFEAKTEKRTPSPQIEISDLLFEVKLNERGLSDSADPADGRGTY